MPDRAQIEPNAIEERLRRVWRGGDGWRIWIMRFSALWKLAERRGMEAKPGRAGSFSGYSAGPLPGGKYEHVKLLLCSRYVGITEEVRRAAGGLDGRGGWAKMHGSPTFG